MNRPLEGIDSLQRLITNSGFITKYRKRPPAFNRLRKLSFSTIVSANIRLAKKSQQIECNSIGDRLMSEPAPKQAFRKARHNISYAGFKA